ncbi:transketolase C-terminal domain-containing protein, partial [Actinomyces sp. MRS3W]|uniref:transketolase C-terminal domain-containing protein n=1 Tax=Actinomyces sp. MRS3W TaxID=2800796 RepID=UPI0028FD5152
GTVLDAGRSLAAEGLAVRVVCPRWPVPIPSAVVDMARESRGVLVVEDGLVEGGVGSQLRDAVEDAALADGSESVPRVARVGIPRRFLPTASREELLADFGMDCAGICATARRLAGPEA